MRRAILSKQKYDSEIAWIGVSLDNPYFSPENIVNYSKYLFPQIKYFSVHITDTIYPLAISAKNPMCSLQECISRSEITSERFKKTLKNYLSQKFEIADIEIVKWSELLPSLGASKIENSCWDIAKNNPKVNEILEKKSLIFLSSKNLSLNRRAIAQSKEYLLRESVISTFLRENTAYSTEITPYDQLGCIPEIYSEDCFEEIRDLLIPGIPKEGLHTIRFD